MSARNDGGPAFPGVDSESDQCAHPTHVSGMSLRDWFAGQALAGYIMNSAYDTVDSREVARISYEMADAMLEARDAEAGK